MGKIQKSSDEKLIIELQKIREDSSINVSTRNFAAGLLAHYLTVKSFTAKQRYHANNTVSRVRREKKLKVKPKEKRKYYLYAMVAGFNVKLGYTSCIKKRKAQIQTSCAEKVDCVWSYPCGSTEKEAKAFEKKMHRFCSKYKVRGEWFSNECLPLLVNFKPKLRCNNPMQDVNEAIELELDSKIDLSWI